MTRIVCLASRTWLVIVSLLATAMGLALCVVMGLMSGITYGAHAALLVVGTGVMTILPGLVGLSVAAFARRLVWPCLLGLSLAFVLLAAHAGPEEGGGWSRAVGGVPLWATVCTLGVVGLLLGACEVWVRLWGRFGAPRPPRDGGPQD